MVSALTFRPVGLFLPLLRKSDPLGVPTHRTIPLFSIFSIKGMSHFTHNLFLVDRSNRIRVLKGVFLHRYNPKMIYGNATSILTKMINNHTIRYTSFMSKVRNSMSPSSFLSKIERTISIFVERALPEFTFSYPCPFRIESICLFFSQMFHVTNDTPYNSVVNR